MNDKKPYQILFVLLGYFIRFITYYPLTFLTLELFVLILVFIVNTPLETLFFKTLLLPIGLFVNEVSPTGSYQLGLSEVVGLLSFWNLIISFIIESVSLITRTRLNRRMPIKLCVLALILLHIGLAVKLRSIAVPGLFLGASLASLLLYRFLSRLGEALSRSFFKEKLVLSSPAPRNQI